MDKMTALTMFVATADFGGFSRAAEQLGKTPSAVTKGVMQLEAELGARLFERTTRRMTLTEAGQLYLEGARQALTQLQLAAEAVDDLQHALRGSLRIVALPPFGPAFLNGACCSFLREHPELRLEVDLNDSMNDEAYDLSLRDGPIDLPGLIAQPLLENCLMLCASPAYIARKGASVTLENYQSHDWLILHHPLLNRNFWWVEHGGERMRLKQPVPRLTSDNFDFLLACLLDGQGLQFLPKWSAAPHISRGELVELDSDYWREQTALGPSVYVLYQPHRRNTRKVRVFIEHLRRHLDGLGIGVQAIA
ncbi:LysR family transcriptional regulator [Paraburkholderia pallida]|uniref:LysR family transcriptional regulator n=1 Tax=Paraburkholderia pallida TaxID=2547399 RepID=A0A4V1B0N0_9BURK|nr:LysR family transcriptional regulator [Paraburkholderia pallida]QBR03343.1 LysR family transcriptional regulator [Paraburkholderia pallida]